jgi:thymidylate kinase
VNTTSPLPAQRLDHVIAVIGCDGSGKSTLTADLFAHLQGKGDIELLYLGQSSGNIGRWIKGLPLVGSLLGSFLDNKAKKAHGDKKAGPDLATVVVIYLLSRWRVHKFRRMLAMNRRGTIVITDRYPQAEIPGFYFDGTGLGSKKIDSWLGRILTAREQKRYEWMANHVPALVIRINIDADTAFARKPDHKLSMLRDKIAVIPKLHFNDAQILDLNGTDPYEQVLDAALKASNAALKMPDENK